MQLRRADRHDERGIVLPLVGIVLVALVAFASLAIDLGFQRVVRRDMQALADVVALDLALQLDGRTRAEIEADAAWAEALADSQERNEADLAGRNVSLVPQLGEVSTSGTFNAVGQNAVPSAVRVTATGTLDYFFRPGSATTTRTAVATKGGAACFSLGSFAAGLTPQANTLLAQLLSGFGGTPPSLQVLGYNGLTTADVDFGLIGTELGLASPSGVLTYQTTLGEFYVATAEALQQQNPGHVGVTALNEIIAQDAPILDTPIVVGDLLNVQPGGEGAAMLASFNLLDLVAGAAFLADGTHAVNIPALGANIANLLSSSASLTIVEAIRPFCGPIGSTASTDQVALDMDVRVRFGLLQVVQVQASLRSASATATLTDVQCSRDGTQQTALISTTTSLASLTASAGLLGIPVQILNASFTGASQPPLTFTVPPPLEQTQTFGQGDAALTDANTSLLGLALSPVVAPILAELEATVVQPLLDMMGLDVAGGTVILRSVTCTHRSLVL